MANNSDALPCSLRIGLGIDFHCFVSKLTKRTLILGGFPIENEIPLQGHSDADIILHSLADAILGALAKGDIGEYFPDTAAENKNLSSKIILDFSLKEMVEAGYAISNVDITLVTEIPKINRYKLGIRQSLKRILKLPQDRIGLQSTTSEKMGAIGRKQGMMCLANVLLYKT